MKFTDYMKEQEEVEVNNEFNEKKAKLVAFFTTGEPISDETLYKFAEEELEMEADEVKEMVYQMLTDLLMAKAEEEGGEEDEAEGELGDEEEIEEDVKKK